MPYKLALLWKLATGLLSVVIVVQAALLAYVWLDYHRTYASGHCGSKQMSDQGFKSACQGVPPGASLLDVLVILGAPESPDCDETGQCTVQVFGGTGMFCDSCVVSYRLDDLKATETFWLYGDQ